MRLNRRQLLLLGGMSGLGLTVVGKTLSRPVTSPPEFAKLPTLPLQPSGKNLILRFVAIADTGSGAKDQFAVGKAMAKYHQSHPYSLVVMAGDNIYTNGEMEKIGSAFEQPYAALLKRGVRFQAALGNHDIRTANGDLQVKYPAFNMKGRYYTYREKEVQFFVLDTNDWQSQVAWLEGELKRSDAPVKVVYGHHPIYSSGQYGTNPEMVEAFTPLFKKYQVQLYMNGHEHNYERTKPIDGTTYLITGHGGANLRSVGRSDWTAHSASRFGFSAIEIYPNRMQIQGIGANGLVYDRGSVPLKIAQKA
ncbi:MAG: metallophosphoesterase [Myxacorys californica WJT36-NPBG1]|jgi:acid phosphatase|nr:metallophosphoesterase [Myxacorys californica WJT36-NPBG1]